MSRRMRIAAVCAGLGVVLLFIACQNVQPAILDVSPERRDGCGGLTTGSRLEVNGECFYDVIEGFTDKFDYEPGSAYYLFTIRTKSGFDATDTPDYIYKLIWAYKR